MSFLSSFSLSCKGTHKAAFRRGFGIAIMAHAALLATVAFTVFTVKPAHADGFLRSAESFVVLSGSTITNTGATTIDGNVGVSPGTAMIGFSHGNGNVRTGTFYGGGAVADQAQTDTATAYNALQNLAFTTDLSGQVLGSATLLTLTPGVYRFSSSAQLTGNLALDAQNNPDALFVFQIGSTLTTASASSVRLINAGSSGDVRNVYWQVGSDATLGAGSSFTGNILALTSITLGTGASINSGRALAQNGAVTLDTNRIIAPASTGAPEPGSLVLLSTMALPMALGVAFKMRCRYPK